MAPPTQDSAEPEQGTRTPGLRAPGIPILLALIVMGMGIPAIYRWQSKVLGNERDKMLASVPDEPKARLGKWFQFGQPPILEALLASRFSAERPWIVSHMVAPEEEGQPPEIWGIDQQTITTDMVVLDGMVVRVILPAPEVMDRDVLVGDSALGVQVFEAPGPPDPRIMLRKRVEYAIERLMRVLPQEIPGALISVEVGGLVRPREE
jgi:hypothetical protein